MSKRVSHGSGFRLLLCVFAQLCVATVAGCSITYERTGTSIGGAERSSLSWLSTSKMGDALVLQGRYRLALEYYEQAKRDAESGGSIQGMAATRGQIGDVYARLGQYERSLESSMEAVLIYERMGDAVNGGRLLMNMAGLMSALERHDDALQALEIAHPLLRRNGEMLLVGGLFYGTMGGLLASVDRDDDAMEAYQFALEFASLDNANRSGILFLIGNLHFKNGRYAEALTQYNQSLELAEGFPMVRPAPLIGIGSVHEQRGEYAMALQFYEESVELQEELLQGAGANQFIASMAESQSAGYRRAIPAAIELGYIERAFELSEYARSRAFVHQLAGAQPGRRESSDMQQLDSLRLQLADIVRQIEINEAADQPDDATIRELKGQEASVEQSLNELSSRVAGTQVVPTAVQPSGVADVASIQQSLDEDTTLVSYFVTGDNVVAFVVSRDSLESFKLPTSQEQLESTIEPYTAFSASSARSLTAATIGAAGQPTELGAAELGDWLIGPIRDQLTTPKIGIIPHGVLNYLSFAAIEDSDGYFGDSHTIFYLPSASTVTYMPEREQRDAEVLAVARQIVEDFAPLEHADREAREVADLYGDEALIGDLATETAVRSGVGESTILHLAAHGEINSAKPIFSRILLGRDGANDGSLYAHEVYELDLSNTDLVVLSACDTQLGPLSRGDDFVALSRAFLAAGASTVVASLWPVNDEATATLMTRFHENLRSGMNKAASLREAQRVTRISYPHPYFWAGFVLSGDPGTDSL